MIALEGVGKKHLGNVNFLAFRDEEKFGYSRIFPYHICTKLLFLENTGYLGFLEGL